MSAGLNFGGQPPAGVASAVTLVEGSTFCVSDSVGGIQPQAAMGLFVRDTRVISGWSLELQTDALEPLMARLVEPFEGMFISRRVPDGEDSATSLMIVQQRSVGDGMREDISVRNFGPAPARCILTLKVAADFADLFDVKAGRAHPHSRVTSEIHNGYMYFEKAGGDGQRRGTRISATQEPIMVPGQIFWSVELKPHEKWTACVEVAPIIDADLIVPRHSCDHLHESSSPAQNLGVWRSNRLVVTTPNRNFAHTIERSLEDLASLRVYDPRHPGRAVVAAGVPWFMTLFGRDSLLSAWMILPFNHDLAIGTLQSLAEAQGTKSDPLTEEQPGRILHEVRFGMQSALALGGGQVYYGTADATELFVMLVGELSNWGGPDDTIASLMPNVDRALEWIENYGDLDGDGFVEYQRQTPNGLRNQGWKDSGDGINFADGELAEPPIALCEVQAYVYGAYRARAQLAQRFGDHAGTAEWNEKASDFKEKFNDAFWLPQRGWYAVGLDREKRPIDALASNMAHGLWTGVVDDKHAAAVADRLLSPEMFSGWGIRTLATTMGAYNPISYHNGSVWPHDSAIAAAGLTRYGRVEDAVRVTRALLDAAGIFDGRLPELFCGFQRNEYPFPIPYPTACSPQAWAAASPMLLLRALLRIDPNVPAGSVRIAPAVPKALLPMSVSNLIVDESRLQINIEGDTCEVAGLGAGLRIDSDPDSRVA